MSCPLCFWKAEKGAFCSRWDDKNDAVGMGTFNVEVPSKIDVVKIGWHIFLKDIMDYAAIRRES